LRYGEDMPLTLLVLGGSSFVGRAVVEEGLARGWDVSTFNRGRQGGDHAQVTRLIGDRLDPATLAPLTRRDWDLVVDTWSGAPRAVRDSAAVLADHAGRYGYISSASVYGPGPPPLGVDESGPTVDASPDADGGEYPELKRGAEIALIRAFGDRALLARAGTILGPYENVGRLPWWLIRLAAGGEVLAPGPPELQLQYVDARDLARFVLDAAPAGHSGAFNVVSRRGHATMASLHAANVERAHAAGLRCRPLRATVADTWAWLSGPDGPAPLRPDRSAPGLERARERAVLDAWHARAG
jgi:2'-hydroxyisoflavone reductase